MPPRLVLVLFSLCADLTTVQWTRAHRALLYLLLDHQKKNGLRPSSKEDHLQDKGDDQLKSPHTSLNRTNSPQKSV